MENKVLFHLSNNKSLVRNISNKIDISVGELEINKFADGESLVRIISDIKDKDVYVVQSISKPTSESLMEALIFANATKNKGAKSITLISPYMGYSRQDRIAKDGEPITSQLVAELISISGFTSFYTFDIHTLKTIEYFKINAKNISSSDVFASYYQKLLKEKHIDNNDVVIVSPDHGSYNRGQELSKKLKGSSFAIISKYRPKPNEAKSIKIDGDVNNKHAIIVDDIIDTAGTLIGAISLLKQKSVKSIFVCATHGLFSINSSKLKELVDDLVVTDSVNQKNNLKVLSLADEIIKIIEK